MRAQQMPQAMLRVMPLVMLPVMPLACGALGVLAFAPFRLWPLMLVSIAGLFYAWHKAQTWRQAMLAGFLWGMGLFLCGVSWLYVSLHDFGGMPAPLAALGIFLFCALLAAFPALAGAVVVGLRGTETAGSLRERLMVMPAAFVMAEMLRGWFGTGFPWLSAGYSQTPGALIEAPLAGFAPLVGVFGISWLLALMAAMVLALLPQSAQRANRASYRRHAAIILTLIGMAASGVALRQIDWSQPSGEMLSVSLLQGNVEQSLKWREDHFQNTLRDYSQLVEASQARLIILPETAIPVWLDQIPPEFLARLAAHARANNGDVVLGVPITEREAANSSGRPIEAKRYFNSAWSVGSSSSQRYDKSHLVIFGEFSPPLFGWVYRWLNIPLSGFARGAETQAPMRVSGHWLGINICYEDAFGAEIANALPQAELLVNLSNMAWYGRSLAADQHAQFSQMRAMEMSRWMLRATNSGVTAAIDEKGRIVAAMPQFERGVLDVEAQPHQGATPYSRWRDMPVLAALVLIALVALAGLALRRQARKM